MQTQSASRFKYTMSDFGQIRIMVWHQMEPEDIFTSLNIYSIVLQDKIIMIVELFAASYVYRAEIQTQCDQVTQSLPSNICAANIYLFQA